MTAQNINIDAALSEAEAAYTARNPRSAARHEAAKASLPGGNTRSVLHFEPFPITVSHGEGCRIWSLDGQELIDFLGEYSAGLYGHSHPVIREAVSEALSEGIVLGAPSRFEAPFAEALCERFPAIERLRFCNSGSEANLMCLSLARAVTGRQSVMAFRGAYHGGFLVFPEGPAPLNAPFRFIMADYNKTEETRILIRENARDLAAVIVEPMIGAGGCMPGHKAFLRMLREESEATGTLLVFDEVITSRLSPGGLQALTGVEPDLTALGKYLGGGLTFGAFGGRADLMDRFDPSRPEALMHAGTFNNNVLTMAAGGAGLSKVLTPDAISTINERGDRLRDTMHECFRREEVAMTATGMGSLMTIHFLQEVPERPCDLKAQDPRLKRLFHLSMLENGIYLASRGMLALSLPMTNLEIEAFENGVRNFIESYRTLIGKPKVQKR